MQNVLVIGASGGIGAALVAEAAGRGARVTSLSRRYSGLDLTDDDIAAMGVGGLLKEIPIRPQPREG